MLLAMEIDRKLLKVKTFFSDLEMTSQKAPIPAPPGPLQLLPAPL